MAGSVKVSGVWKDLTEGHVKVSGVWKEITEGYVRVSGVWKQIHASSTPAFFDGTMTVGNQGINQGYIDHAAATNIGSISPSSIVLIEITARDNPVFGDEIDVRIDDDEAPFSQPASLDITIDGNTVNLPYVSTGSVGWYFSADDETMSDYLRTQNGNTIDVVITVNA